MRPTNAACSPRPGCSASAPFVSSSRQDMRKRGRIAAEPIRNHGMRNSARSPQVETGGVYRTGIHNPASARPPTCRGRNSHRWLPPAQIRTSGITAYGFHERPSRCQPKFLLRPFGGSRKGACPLAGGAAVFAAWGEPARPGFPFGETGKGYKFLFLAAAG
jgi:hypothetical protein